MLRNLKITAMSRCLRYSSVLTFPEKCISARKYSQYHSCSHRRSVRLTTGSFYMSESVKWNPKSRTHSRSRLACPPPSVPGDQWRCGRPSSPARLPRVLHHWLGCLSSGTRRGYPGDSYRLNQELSWWSNVKVGKADGRRISEDESTCEKWEHKCWDILQTSWSWETQRPIRR
jgi:hypothetical protein